MLSWVSSGALILKGCTLGGCWRNLARVLLFGYPGEISQGLGVLLLRFHETGQMTSASHRLKNCYFVNIKDIKATRNVEVSYNSLYIANFYHHFNKISNIFSFQVYKIANNEIIM